MKSENPRKENVFSKKITLHGMDLRNYENFEVKFEEEKNTLKTSSIPYLQRILNSENY